MELKVFRESLYTGAFTNAKPTFAIIVRDGTDAAFSVASSQDCRGRLIRISLTMSGKIPVFYFVSRIDVIGQIIGLIWIGEMINCLLYRNPWL